MLYLTLLALAISIIALIMPIVDKDFRRGYMFAKLEKQAVKDILKLRMDRNEKYYMQDMKLSWAGTAYHLMPGLVNQATNKLIDFHSPKTEVRSTVLMVILKDYKMVKDGVYKLNLKDPFAELWTEPIEISRDFLERNLDYIIRVEGEIVNKNTSDGVILMNPEMKNKYVYQPLKVDETGQPVEVLDMQSHNIELR
ncbi:MAG: hypothetical protein IBX70_07785 [Clostridia bacterium]|nr:hypothetical protein [Clostridia bacterium]